MHAGNKWNGKGGFLCTYGKFKSRWFYDYSSWGLDICYPSEHRLLKQRIEEQGLLLSEYPPGIPPHSCHIPKWNRGIAAWSREINVPEEGKKSGVWITAVYGKNMGEDCSSRGK